jgi:hypothetical protein
MKKLLISALMVSTPLMAFAADDDMAQRKAESKATIQEFAGKLKGHLQAAMKEGGPINAIQVCSQIAPQLARDISEQKGWSVSRTSLRQRNAGNTPDAWEIEVLNKFEERKAAGEDVQPMAFAAVVESDGKKEFRFMKAIPTGEVCLTCHGEKIDAKIAAKLDELYPNDMARGYKLGDIRGAFSIRQPM